MKKKTSKEWAMIIDLRYAIKKVKNKNQRNFINGLYENLNEFSNFLDEQTPEQLEYLKTLHEIYIK